MMNTSISNIKIHPSISTQVYNKQKLTEVSGIPDPYIHYRAESMLAVCIPRSSNTPSNSLIVLSVPIFSIYLREFLIRGTEWAIDCVTLDVR